MFRTYGLEKVVEEAVARRVAKAVYRKAELGQVSLADFPMMCHSYDVLENGKDAELPWESFTYDHTK